MPQAPVAAPVPGMQSMIVSAFSAETFIANRMDVQHTPIYDTVTIAQAGAVSTLTTAFFTNVGPASGKSMALTNMNTSQRLPAPQAFSIQSIRIRISENTLPPDWYILFNQFCFELWLGDKCYNRAPLWYYAAGGGIWGVTTQNFVPGGSGSIYANGVPSHTGILTLAIPIVIESQMQFYGQFNGTATTLTAAAAGGLGAIIVALLDGLYARGVQ